MTALSIVVLLGITALAVDASYMFDYRNKMAAAAVAAALAGAREIKRNPDIDESDPLPLRYLVQHEATSNGFTDGSNGVTVTVNHPPTSGTFNGNSKYVEVIVSRAATPTFFARLLNRSTMNVGARAVAGLGGGGTGCVYVLSNSAASKGFETSGASTTGLQVPNCSIHVNRQSSNAFFVSSGWTINAKEILVVGGYDLNGASVTPTPITGASKVDDPFADVPTPVAAATCDANHTSMDYKNVTRTIDPGTYCDGIKIDGSSVVTLNPGLYIIKEGALVVKDTATVKNTSTTDAGVTIWITGTTPKPSSFTNGTSIQLHATTSGTYAGVLLAGRIVGTSTSNIFDSDDQALSGAVYFPSQHFEWKGSGGAYTILVADTMKFTGNSTLNSNFASIGGQSPVPGPASLGE